MTSITNKAISKDPYQTPAFLSFSQSTQKNRPRDEFSSGRSVFKVHDTFQKEDPSITSNRLSVFHSTPEKTMELYKCYIKLMCRDTIDQIFLQCWSNNDITGIQALTCTNKHFYKNITMIVNDENRVNLKQLCPLLKIVSAEEAQKYGFPAQPELIFPKLKLVNAYQEMAPHVEGNAGVSYFNFTLPEELTLRQIVEIAKGQGIEVDISWINILLAKSVVAIRQAFPCILANNVFIDSRNKNYYEQCALVRGHGCKLPTLEQYIIQIVLISKISNQSLCLFGRNPETWGCSSTFVLDLPFDVDLPLVVGGSAPASLDVHRCRWVLEVYGAGGRRM